MLNYQRVYQNDNVIVAHVPSTQFWPCGMVETIPKKGFFGSPPGHSCASGLLRLGTQRMTMVEYVYQYQVGKKTGDCR